jgi:5-methylthioadenosine/S-adenosylhomocysteine deaminase
MWQVMRMAAHLIAYKHSPADVDAAEIFHMATIGGAKALGIDHLVGSVEIGKAADLIAIDLAKPHLTPIHDIFALLIFAVGRSDISDVYIDGEAVVKNGSSTRVDHQEIMNRANSRILDLKNL